MPPYLCLEAGVPGRTGSRSSIISNMLVTIRDLVPAYKQFITPMLNDQNLDEGSELGVLMVGSPVRRNKNSQAPWTVFVKPDWLRWVLAGENSGFRPAPEIPPDQIFGQVPGWPDNSSSYLQKSLPLERRFNGNEAMGSPPRSGAAFMMNASSEWVMEVDARRRSLR